MTLITALVLAVSLISIIISYFSIKRSEKAVQIILNGYEPNIGSIYRINQDLLVTATNPPRHVKLSTGSIILMLDTYCISTNELYQTDIIYIDTKYHKFLFDNEILYIGSYYFKNINQNGYLSEVQVRNG